MPKTKKRFDWEVRDKDGKFLDILTMTRNEAKDYAKKRPDLVLQEIAYTDNDKDDSF